MRARVPVLAASTGGPVETVVDGVTGWLRDTDKEEAWRDVMARVLAELSDDEMGRMGEAGLARVRESFGRDKMAARLEDVLAETLSVRPRKSHFFDTLMNVLVVGAAFIVGLGFAKGYWTVKQARGQVV